MEFQDEYWPEALKTLRREERKAFLKRWLPWTGLLLLLLGSLLFLMRPGAEMACSAIPDDQYTSGIFRESYPEKSDDQASLQPGTSIHSAKKPEAVQGGSAESSGSSLSNSSAERPEAGNLAPEINELPSAQYNREESQTAPTLPLQNLQGKEEMANKVSTTPAGVRPATPGIPSHSAMLRSAILTEGAEQQAEGIQGPAHGAAAVFVGKPMKGLPQTQVGLSLIRQKPATRDQDFPGRMFEWKQNHFYLIAGNSFATGFGSRNGDVLLDPEIGVGYERLFIDPQWSGRVSLNYFSIGGITHNADFAQQELGFGLTTTVTSIATERLHFVFLPLELNYNPTKRSTLTGGLGISYLINSLSEVTVSEITYQDSQELDRFEEWGYVGGYKSLNASLLAGYEFRFTPNLWLGGQYQYGLTRITKESIYGRAKEDRNSRLRLYIKYALAW